jgi:hypothetical protein
MIRGSFPGWRDGKPRIITQGVFDGDAVVYELFSMQTVVFDARINTFQSIPLPIFASDARRVGVLSLMVKRRMRLQKALRGATRATRGRGCSGPARSRPTSASRSRDGGSAASASGGRRRSCFSCSRNVS